MRPTKPSPPRASSKPPALTAQLPMEEQRPEAREPTRGLWAKAHRGECLGDSTETNTAFRNAKGMGPSVEEVLLWHEGLGRWRKGLLRILALRGPWREGEESPDSRKVGGGRVGAPSFSGLRAIGKSGGTRGEHGGCVEGRVHWISV